MLEMGDAAEVASIGSQGLVLASQVFPTPPIPPKEEITDEAASSPRLKRMREVVVRQRGVHAARGSASVKSVSVVVPDSQMRR